MERLCTRACWLEDGRIVLDASPKEVGDVFVSKLLDEERIRNEKHNSSLYSNKKAEAWQNENEVGHYKTSAAQFIEISLRKTGGKGKGLVFAYAESIDILVKLKTYRTIKPCVLCIIIYDSLGNQIALSREILDELAEGFNTLVFRINNPPLRQGKYFTSVVLYEEWDDNYNKPGRIPFLAFWYRCLTFSINENRRGVINFGIVKLHTSLFLE